MESYISTGLQGALAVVVLSLLGWIFVAFNIRPKIAFVYSTITISLGLFTFINWQIYLGKEGWGQSGILSELLDFSIIFFSLVAGLCTSAFILYYMHEAGGGWRK